MGPPRLIGRENLFLTPCYRSRDLDHRQRLEPVRDGANSESKGGHPARLAEVATRGREDDQKGPGPSLRKETGQREGVGNRRSSGRLWVVTTAREPRGPLGFHTCAALPGDERPPVIRGPGNREAGTIRAAPRMGLTVRGASAGR